MNLVLVIVLRLWGENVPGQCISVSIIILILHVINECFM